MAALDESADIAQLATVISGIDETVTEESWLIDTTRAEDIF